MRGKMEAKRKTDGEKNLKDGEAFLAANAKKEGVKTLPSGLQYKVLKSGSGKTPKATDTVKTHYHGTLIDGTVFDSSVERGEPVEFPVNGVIPGWTEALQLMKEGDKWQLFVPAKLAYGERGAGGKIGPNSTLIFEGGTAFDPGARRGCRDQVTRLFSGNSFAPLPASWARRGAIVLRGCKSVFGALKFI